MRDYSVARFTGFVNNNQLVIERGSILRIPLAAKGDIRSHVVLFFDVRPPLPECGRIVSHALSRNGNQAAARLQTFQRLFDMAGTDHSIPFAAHALPRRTERGIHNNNGRVDVFRKDVVDLLGILLEIPVKVKHSQDIQATVGNLVDNDFVCPCHTCKDCNVPRTSARFKHHISRADLFTQFTT